MSDIKVYTANVNDLWEIPSDEVGMTNASHFVKFRDFHELTKQNAQLKEDKAELAAKIELNNKLLAAVLGNRNGLNGSDFCAIECLVKNNSILIQKHKEQNNE